MGQLAVYQLQISHASLAPITLLNLFCSTKKYFLLSSDHHILRQCHSAQCYSCIASLLSSSESLVSTFSALMAFSSSLVLWRCTSPHSTSQPNILTYIVWRCQGNTRTNWFKFVYIWRPLVSFHKQSSYEHQTCKVIKPENHPERFSCDTGCIVQNAARVSSNCASARA